MMIEDIKILVCTHKEPVLMYHPYFYPIQVGSAFAKQSLCPAQDNTGENISDKNPHYCELTAHYWAWKNLKCDIIGLNHYRRFFDFYRPFPSFSPDRSFINADFFFEKEYKFPNLTKMLQKYDIILPPKRHYPYNVATQYSIFHIVNDLNIVRETIQDITPDYLTAFDHLMQKENAYSGYNMFITRWEIFSDYSKWLFDILFAVEKKVKLSNYADQARIFGYISERLINVYCMKNKLKIKYTPIIMPLGEENKAINPSNTVYSLRRLKNDFIFLLLKL